MSDDDAAVTLPTGASSPLLAPQVRAGWLAFCAPLEGHVDTMYRDVRGLVTTAAGILCDSPEAAERMSWVKPDGSAVLAADVAAEWQRVHAMPAGLRWQAYAVPGCLRLAPGELERVVLDRLDADVRTLFHRWPAFPAFPPAAQAALCSLAWAVGAGAAAHGITGPEWPHLQAAVGRQDWGAAAVAGILSAAGNPGVVSRNWCQTALFLLAAGRPIVDTLASLPAGLVRDATSRALAGLDL